MVAKMTRAERILTAIISGLRTTAVLGPYGKRDMPPYGSEAFEKNHAPGYYVHFAPWLDPEPGMIVMCDTSSLGPWKIAEVVEVHSDSHCLLRSLRDDGSLCNMSNEKFTPIVGLEKEDLYTNGQRAFYQKAVKAFQQQGSWKYRFGGLDFEKKGNQLHVTIWVREVFSGHEPNRESVPFAVSMRYSSKTSIEAIEKALVDGGLGTREFEYVPSAFKIGLLPVCAVLCIDGEPVMRLRSFNARNVTRGYRLTLVLQGKTTLPDFPNSFTICAKTHNGEHFVLSVTNVLSWSVKKWGDPGFDVLVENLVIEEGEKADG